MNKKIKVMIAIGGTGGHVFPGCCLADHLDKNIYDTELVTDIRGMKFLNHYQNFKVHSLPSAPLKKEGMFSILFSIFFIKYSIIRSIIFLIFRRPAMIFGMGGYASFLLCSAAILRIKFFIYENNLILGKANKYLIPLTDKILVSSKELEGISKKYDNKIIVLGNIIKKKIIKSDKNKNFKKNKNLSILVLGGSQAAEIFAKILPAIFRECSEKGINLNVTQHCSPHQNESLRTFYKNTNINFKIFNFSNNLDEYFKEVDLAITRSGSSMLAELKNACIPFVSIPLPSSADNHQLKNAEYYERKKMGFLIQEKDLKANLFSLIKEIYENNTILEKIKIVQSHHSDKKVYKNIDDYLKTINDEKN